MQSTHSPAIVNVYLPLIHAPQGTRRQMRRKGDKASNIAYVTAETRCAAYTQRVRQEACDVCKTKNVDDAHYCCFAFLRCRGLIPGREIENLAC